MQMIYCTGNIEIMKEFQNKLEELEVTNYQLYDRVLANNEFGPPRLDNPVWPGHNFSIFIQESNSDKVSAIKNMIKSMNNEARGANDLVSCYIWSIAEYIVD